MREQMLHRFGALASLFGLAMIASSLAAGAGVSGAADARPKDEPAPKPKPSFECRRATGPITLDGKADEPAWKAAETLDNFVPYWLTTPEKPARKPYTKASARLLWDDEFLYFHCDMEDADLFADVLEQDGECWNNDVFELFFKPSELKPAYYEFEVTPANTHFDMFVPKREVENFLKWAKASAFGWKTKVDLRGTLNDRKDRDRGWSVEGRIPWSDFEPTGGRPAMGDRWKFTLCRYDYSVDFAEPELSATAPLTKKDYHHTADYSTLIFVGEK